MRHKLRVLRAHVLGWIGVLRLMVAITRGKVDQVVLGDSNAAYAGSDRLPPLGIGSTRDRIWVWHLGPRLMYSISQGNLKPSVRRVLRLVGRLPRNRDVVWMFQFGEIDVRCHLAPRVQAGDQLDFVGPFLARLQDLVRDLRVPFGVYMMPVPVPTIDYDHELFPVLGTKEDRRGAHAVLRERVLKEAAALDTDPPIHVLDLTDELSDEDGWYDTDLHLDGVHFNDAGREVIQTHLARLLATLPR